jgi:dipeptidyl aminopeptidase/acylaminoacyl peptidase
MEDKEAKKKKSNSLKSILGGDILATDFFRRQTKLLVLIMVLIIFYIHNRYASQQQQIEIDKLKKELIDIKYDALTRSSELMEKSRQSRIEDYISTKESDYLTSKINWNVENFSFSEDKKQLVFITNEAGRNKMYLMNTKDQSYSEVKNIPTGLIGGAEFTKDNQSLFFTQSTAQTASDVYRLSLKNGKIEQWTASELGEMQASDMALPKFIEWKSFDGLGISGFYYPAPR